MTSCNGGTARQTAERLSCLLHLSRTPVDPRRGLKWLAIETVTGPVPLGPDRVTILNGANQLGMEVRDAVEHGPPVGLHLGTPHERTARVHRLLTAVVLIHQACSALEVVPVHQRRQPLHDIRHQPTCLASSVCRPPTRSLPIFPEIDRSHKQLCEPERLGTAARCVRVAGIGLRVDAGR
jgi:hypothetical protein